LDAVVELTMVATEENRLAELELEILRRLSEAKASLRDDLNLEFKEPCNSGAEQERARRGPPRGLSRGRRLVGLARPHHAPSLVSGRSRGGPLMARLPRFPPGANRHGARTEGKGCRWPAAAAPRALPSVGKE